MSDVFISYAREDQAVAKALADDLKARGFDVWWDTELLASDDFYEAILAALAKARAAIVIWSKHSARSRFVRDEARYALHLDKLVATKVADLDVHHIPFGFQGQHTEDVTNHDRIVKAIEHHGARPNAATAGRPTEDVAWERAKSTSSAGELLEFVEKYPTSVHREAAIQKIRALLQSGARSKGADAESGFRVSNFTAFLQGLTLRIPSFQPAAQGVSTAIGSLVAYFVLSVVGFLIAAGVHGIVSEYAADAMKGAAASAAIFVILALAAWRRFHKWLQQRNFIAAIVMALMCIFLTMCIIVPYNTLYPAEVSEWMGYLLILSIIYALWQIWKAR